MNLRARLEDLAHAAVELKQFDELALALGRARMLAGQAPSHHELFGKIGDFQWYWLNTVGQRNLRFIRDVLPSLPDPKTQKGFVGRSGDAALRDAFNVYRTIKSLVTKYGHPLRSDSTVLDFGCGWGRILRFFLRDVAPGNLFGVDAMPLAIDLCRKTNPWADFSLVSALPPSALPSDRFDLIYLYSVFSHLSEDAHDMWLTEFRRILKPGGLLIATTRPRAYIVSCETYREKPEVGLHYTTLGAFKGTEEWLARYDRGEYCYSPVGGGSLDATLYGEACIPEAYVRDHWTDRFEFLDYLGPPRRRLQQDVIVVKKRLID